MFISIYKDYKYSDYSNINTLEGIVSDIYIDKEKIVLDIENDVKVRCTFYYEDYNFDLNLGDKVKLTGTYDVPSDNTNINLFSYRNYLKSKDIFYLFNISNIEKISSNSNIFYSSKNFIINRVNNNDSYKYLYTFILGDTRYLDDDIKGNYQSLGISHLFSISGMHISILTFIIMFIFKKLKIDEDKGLLFSSLFIIYFMFLVNYCPSVLRSGIFYIFISINKMFYFNIKNSNLLLFTISIILFINPFIIYNTGFLYSSIITWSLIVFSSFINKYDNYFIKLFMTSVLAFLFSFPISIYSSYQINLFTVIYNLVFVPIISMIVFPMSLLCLFLPFLSSIFDFFISIVENLSIVLSSIDSVIIFKKPSILVVLIYYFLIIICFLFKKRFMYYIFLFIIFIHYNYNVIFYSNYILLIDVGQGDSILLHSGKYDVLIDTGGSSYNEGNIAKNTTIPLLKSLGIRDIDYLFLSHGDMDHLGESYYLVNNFKVSNVYFNEGDFNNNEIRLINLLDELGIKYFVSYEGEYYEFGDFKLFSLGTDLVDENDSSMIIYGLIKDYSFLFMGDASIKSEEVLIKKYNISDIDILKVGHHGSRTSSSDEFIDMIRPKYSLISVGNDNKFGHPNKEVLEVLKESIIYRTDLNGSIMFEIKKNKLNIETRFP